MRNDSLSPTLVEVLELMSRGLTNKEIAFQLQKSVSTINSQVSAILKITDCRNRVEACVYYFLTLRNADALDLCLLGLRSKASGSLSTGNY